MPFIHTIRPRQVEEEKLAQAPDNAISLFAALLLVVFVIMLLAFGLTMVQSTTVDKMGNVMFYKQCMWAGAGMFLAFFVVFLGPKRITDWKVIVPVILLTWGMLLAARFVFPPINGAHRWIQLGSLGNIQPSEIAKFALVLMMARWASDNVRAFNNILTEIWRHLVAMVKSPNMQSFAFLAPLFMFFVSLGLVFLGKDLGMSILILAATGGIVFVAGLQWRYILLVILTVAGGIAALCMDTTSFRYQRIIAFLDPENAGEAGMQIWMSLLALGSGGLYGRGLGEGRLKTGYLPEDHTDCILSIAGEELGYIGMVILIIIFVMILITATIITLRAANRVYMFVASGFTIMLAVQMAMNIAVITNAMPAKGMPAPFISYGGSNLVTSLVAIGILVAIAIDSAFPHHYDSLFGFLKSKNTNS